MKIRFNTDTLGPMIGWNERPGSIKARKPDR